MKLAYFSNQFADKQGHGIARYARELYHALTALKQPPKITPIATWSSLGKRDLATLTANSNLTILPWGRKLTPLSWLFFNRPLLESWLDQPIDIVHAASLGYPIATKKPYVVTIHDIGPLTHPEFFTKKAEGILKRSLQQAVSKADAFICVSNSSADELDGYIGGNISNRIHVIPEGISSFISSKANTPPAILEELLKNDTPYILTTGKISPRKNTVRIIKALNKLADKLPHHLIIVGGDGWSINAIYQEIGRSDFSSRIHCIGYVSDQELAALYQSASVYLHPSLYEGFGLTVLEAMAANCPVITSNNYSLPEVAGNAALLVDPYNIDEIAGAIQAICSDTSLSSQLRAKGQERLNIFSWKKCAQKTFDVYKKIV